VSDSGKLPSPSLNLLLHGPKPVKAGTSAPIGAALTAPDPMSKTPNKKAKGAARSESCGETCLTPEFVGQVATISIHLRRGQCAERHSRSGGLT